MRIIGLAGWSGAGKTTLVTQLIPVFLSRGLKVSTVKHAHKGFDIDLPGTGRVPTSIVHRFTVNGITFAAARTTITNRRIRSLAPPLS